MAAVAALVVVAVAVAALSGGEESKAVAVAAVPSTTAAAPITTPTTTPRPEAPFEAAHAVVPEVALYDSPSAPVPSTSLPNPTVDHVPLVFGVKQHGPPGWLQVQINQRPNEATAWVRAADVMVTPVENRIEVSVSGHQLTVYKGLTDEVLFQAPVAVGSARTPTPLGSFYVDVVVDLDYKGGPYGAYQLSVAGFSDVLLRFGSGIGQIAIHGTDQPELIGEDFSRGCIPLTNEHVTALVPYAPVGTPVIVSA